MRYDCVQCGRCCRSDWEISLDDASVERLRAVDLEGMLREAQLPGPAIRTRGTEKAQRSLCHTEKGCAFLGADNRCRIHAAHDYETKPQVCKDFPYRYLATPEGTVAGLSFACTAVLQDVGRTMEEQRPWLEENRQHSLAWSEAPERIAIAEGTTFGWDAYAEIDRALRAIADVPGRTTAEFLVAQSIWLDHAAKLSMELRATPAVPPAKAFSALSARLLGERGAEAAPLWEHAARLRPDPALERAFVGLLTAYRHTFLKPDRRPGRAAALVGVVGHYLRTALALGDVRLAALPAPFPFRALHEIAFPGTGPDAAAIESLLRRYFTHLLWRKELLYASSVCFGHRLWLFAYALVRWHAIGRASLAGRNAVAIDDAREAIRDVETMYFFHSRFCDIFDGLPLLKSHVMTLASKPGLARALMG